MVLSLMSSKWEDGMPINLSEDIRSVTDLKRKTKEILSQVHRTKRPVVLTLNGKARRRPHGYDNV